MSNDGYVGVLLRGRNVEPHFKRNNLKTTMVEVCEKINK
jgi:hypothetical protein